VLPKLQEFTQLPLGTVVQKLETLHHFGWFLFVLVFVYLFWFFEMGSCYVAQTALELDPPASAS
jgi:hypothetical protein